jgi:hypothetical protein
MAKRTGECARLGWLVSRINLSLATVLMCGLVEVAAAQGVAFQSTSLPRQLRQDGITEVAGDIALTSLSSGTILAGSSIDFDFSAAVTNNTSASTNNISLSNSISCTGAGCPTGAVLVGSHTIRLAFASSKSFVPGDQIYLSRVRVDAHSAVGAGNVEATISASSSDPGNNPISIASNTTLSVGVITPTLVVTPHSGQPAIKSFLSCSLPPGSAFNVQVSGPMTSLANELQLSPAATPTNGTEFQLTFGNIPLGVTLTAPSTVVGNYLPTDGGAIDSTGSPITLHYTVATSSNGSSFAQLPFSLAVTGGGSTLDPVGSPVSIEVTAKVGPVTADNSVIVRFADNQYGPVTVATISDCRPSLSRLISD